MATTIDKQRRGFLHMAAALGLASVTPVESLVAPAVAGVADAIPLRLYNANTRERYDVQLFVGNEWNAAGLVVCDWMMRDWRENEVVHCDRRLYAALYVLQRYFGSNSTVTINSGYRSAKTNAMLRNRSLSETGGRATWMTPAINSLHTHARAVDFVIPGADLSRVGEAVWDLNLGGLGRYETFNHMDTGTRRRWGRGDDRGSGRR